LTSPNSAYLHVLFAQPPTIIVVNIRSPANAVKRGNPGISPDEIQHRIPPLNRWSDVAWSVWRYGEGAVHPEWVRYIGYDRVRDAITLPVIQFIIARLTGNKEIDHPGLVYTTDQPEGIALLGTPLGKGVGWLLHDWGQKLRIRDRPPGVTVRIWSRRGEWFMLWDLQPHPDQGTITMKPKRGGALQTVDAPAPTMTANSE
ncbi:MAG: hypothetical protein LQ352_008424, partial [Teloschistes flavicans]